MTSKKSGFWTFIFSLFPGAGEMYLGFLRQGTSIMILFFGIFALTAGFNLNFLMFLLPVVWCYSFFHTHNLRSMPDEEFYALEDHFLFLDPEDDFYTSKKVYYFFRKHKTIAAWILVILGATLLWNSLLDYLYQILPESLYNILYSFSYNLPQLFLALLFIALGFYLINGKKKQLEQEENMDDFYAADSEEMNFNPTCYQETSQTEIQPPVPVSSESEPTDSLEDEAEPEHVKESDIHDQNP